MQKLLFSSVAFLITLFSLAQYDSEKNYNFQAPLDIPLVLAANFGELRSNHFHTGLDFKTNRAIGYKLYAIDSGWVSRVKVSPWGYGKVVYIDHPNGLTSVYAHCSEFKGLLKSTVEKIQRQEENFAIEYFPKKGEISVTKGEVFALSGNSGSSTAPHLHFEIRETATEHALNPLLFGFNVKDNTPPSIRAVKVYGLTERGYRIPNLSKTYSTSKDGKKLMIGTNQITIPSNYCSEKGGIGFAFDAIDKLDAAPNVCGIFKSWLIVDGDTVFGQKMSEIYFESNRQINTHKDYEEYHTKRKQYQKSFKTIHNPLPIYSLNKTGILNFNPAETHAIQYYCEDTKGNSNTLSFNLIIENGQKGDSQSVFPDTKSYMFPDSAFMDIDEEHLVLFGPGLLYEPAKNYITKGVPFGFGNSKTPLQSKFKVMLAIDTLIYPKSKYLITQTKYNGITKSIGGNIKDNWITAYSKEFGTFNVETDTISPSLKAVNVKEGVNIKGKKLIWKVVDNLSGLANYDVYLDGKWCLLEYDAKKSALIFSNVKTTTGKHELKIVATDNCGNTKGLLYSVVYQ